MPYYFPKKASLFVTLLLLLSKGVVAQDQVQAVSIDAINGYALEYIDNPIIEQKVTDKFTIQENIVNIITDTQDTITKNIAVIEKILKKEGETISKITSGEKTDTSIISTVNNMFDDIVSVLGNDIPAINANKLAIQKILTQLETVAGYQELQYNDEKLIKNTLYALNDYLLNFIHNKNREALEEEHIKRKTEIAELNENLKELKKSEEINEAKISEITTKLDNAWANKDRIQKLLDVKQLELDQSIYDQLKKVDPKIIAGGGVGLITLLCSVLYYIFTRKEKEEIITIEKHIKPGFYSTDKEMMWVEEFRTTSSGKLAVQSKPGGKLYSPMYKAPEKTAEEVEAYINRKKDGNSRKRMSKKKR